MNLLNNFYETYKPTIITFIVLSIAFVCFVIGDCRGYGSGVRYGYIDGVLKGYYDGLRDGLDIENQIPNIPPHIIEKQPYEETL